MQADQRAGLEKVAVEKEFDAPGFVVEESERGDGARDEAEKRMEVFSRSKGEAAQTVLDAEALQVNVLLGLNGQKKVPALLVVAHEEVLGFRFRVRPLERACLGHVENWRMFEKLVGNAAGIKPGEKRWHVDHFSSAPGLLQGRPEAILIGIGGHFRAVGSELPAAKR